jgi:hypothetical protein
VLVHSRSSNMVTKLGVVACTYNVSHSGGWGRRIVWAKELKASLGNNCETLF